MRDGCRVPSERLRLVGAALLAVALCVLIGPSTALAQSDTLRRPLDTVTTSDTDSSILGSQPYVMTKSPGLATVLSLVAGGGQIYNEQYIKAVLFAGTTGFFIGQAVFFHGRYADVAAEVDAIPLEDSTRTYRRSQLRNLRESYRDTRDLNIAYAAGVTILSMIDAYVGAHLFDFDVDGGDESLTSRLYLDPARRGIGLAMTF